MSDFYDYVGDEISNIISSGYLEDTIKRLEKTFDIFSEAELIFNSTPYFDVLFVNPEFKKLCGQTQNFFKQYRTKYTNEIYYQALFYDNPVRDFVKYNLPRNCDRFMEEDESY